MVVGRRPERDPPHRFRRPWQSESMWHNKTKEKEGGGEGMKAIRTSQNDNQDYADE